jgi:hypothetical protein
MAFFVVTAVETSNLIKNVFKEAELEDISMSDKLASVMKLRIMSPVKCK